MFSLRAHNVNTGETYFIRLTGDTRRAHLVGDCVRASHFRSAVAAGLTRDRARAPYPELTVSVIPCVCTIGQIAAQQLRQP